MYKQSIDKTNLEIEDFKKKKTELQKENQSMQNKLKQS